MPRPAALLARRLAFLERACWRTLVAALVVVPLVLAVLPGYPAHGYGHVLFALPLLVALRRPRCTRRMLLFALGIGLQTLAYPDPDLTFLGWVLLVPWLASRGLDDGMTPLGAAFLYGFLRAHVGYAWLGNVHYSGWIAVSFASALAFTVCFEGLVRWTRGRVPFALRVATGWILYEWVHSWLFGGFPWLQLGHTQYRALPLIQVASLFGAPAVSFLLAYVQAAVFDAVRRRRPRPELAVAALLLAATLAYGLGAPRPGGSRAERPRVLLVQSAFPHAVKAWVDVSRYEIWKEFVDLTQAGLDEHPDADLIVWPETMMPWPLVEDDPELSEDFLAAAGVGAARFGLPAVYGANTYVTRARIEGLRGHNSAVLVGALERGDPFAPPAILGIYRKQRLVPMGEEFLPRRVLPEPWCDRAFRWLVEDSGLGYPETCDLESGDAFVPLDAGPGLRCAPLICFEGLYPDLARRALREVPEADLLLHLVNNGWFGDAWEQRQAVASWVFRAVETRTPFLSCANAGITCAIGPDGRILGKVDRVFGTGTLLVEVPARGAEPFFLRGGHRVPALALMAVFAAFLLARRRRSAPGAGAAAGEGA